MFIGKDHKAWLQDVVGGDDPRDGLPHPAEIAVERKHDIALAGTREPLCPLSDRGRERLLCRASQRLSLGPLRLRIGGKTETLQLADVMALYHHIARRRDL